MRVFKYILARLKEKSTIVVVVGTVLGLAGASISPEKTEAIIATVAAIVGLIVSFLPEKTVETPE